MVSKVTTKAPTQSFFTLSVSQKRHIVGEVKKIVDLISGGECQKFFEYLCSSTVFGKDHIIPATQNIKLSPIIENIQSLHQTSTAKTNQPYYLYQQISIHISNLQTLALRHHHRSFPRQRNPTIMAQLCLERIHNPILPQLINIKR